MKLTKDYLKEVIKEELEKALEEQTSFADAGKAAAEKRAKEMEAPGAVAQFLKKQGGVNVATDMLAKAAGELEKAGKTQTMDFSDEPMNIVAAKPNTDAIKMVQKKLGVTADGIIGPKTVAAYNNIVKPSKPITVPQLRKLMLAPESGAMIASMLGRKAPASAVATGAGPKSDKMAPEYKQALKDLEDLGKLDLGLEEQFKRFL